jgi:hypothetical protein
LRCYLLNSAVITGPGLYRYRLVTIDEARAWLWLHDCASRIGYAATAEYIFSVLGVRPPISREASPMQPGDEALVVRLKYRVQDPATKGSWQPGPDDWEWGLLTVE